jgi:hypothetical protein
MSFPLASTLPFHEATEFRCCARLPTFMFLPARRSISGVKNSTSVMTVPLGCIRRKGRSSMLFGCAIAKDPTSPGMRCADGCAAGGANPQHCSRWQSISMEQSVQFAMHCTSYCDPYDQRNVGSQRYLDLQREAKRSEPAGRLEISISPRVHSTTMSAQCWRLSKRSRLSCTARSFAHECRRSCWFPRRVRTRMPATRQRARSFAARVRLFCALAWLSSWLQSSGGFRFFSMRRNVR